MSSCIKKRSERARAFYRPDTNMQTTLARTAQSQARPRAGKMAGRKMTCAAKRKRSRKKQLLLLPPCTQDDTDDYANGETPTPVATAAVPLTATTTAAEPRAAASHPAPAAVVHQATAKDNSATTNAESVDIITSNAAEVECNPHSKRAVGATEFELDAFILMLCFM